MSLAEDLLADGPVDVAEMETHAESGGIVPEGRYHAQMIGAKAVESKQKGTPGWELKFQITKGPFKGMEVTHTIWISQDAEKSQKSKENLRFWMYRLGVFGKDGNGKLIAIEGRSDFMDVLDVECVIEVVHEAWKNEETGKSGVSPRCSYAGVWSKDDPRPWEKKEEKSAKDAKSSSAAGASAGKSTTPAATPKPTTSGATTGAGAASATGSGRKAINTALL